MTDDELRDEGAEEWRSIPGFDGYEVSNYGRVRTFWTRAARLRPVLGIHPKVMRLAQDRKGYRHVILRRGGDKFTCRVGRLVLQAFIGPAPPSTECCHGPEGKTSDRLSNLRWGSKVDNEHDKLRDGTRATGERHGMAVLDEAGVAWIRRLLAEGFPQREVARRVGVHWTTVGCIKRGETWTSNRT